MARVTVEDCVLQVPNRFELVMLAAQRSRDLSAGSKPLLDRDNDKNPVVALREIADSVVDLDDLRHALVHGLQKHAEIDEPEDDELSADAIDSFHVTPAEAERRVFGERSSATAEADELAEVFGGRGSGEQESAEEADDPVAAEVDSDPDARNDA